MKIIIFGYGNLGKVLADQAISNNFSTLIVSRKQINHDALTFITIEKFNKINYKKDNSKRIIIGTLKPNCDKSLK